MDMDRNSFLELVQNSLETAAVKDVRVVDGVKSLNEPQYLMVQTNDGQWFSVTVQTTDYPKGRSYDEVQDAIKEGVFLDPIS